MKYFVIFIFLHIICTAYGGDGKSLKQDIHTLKKLAADDFENCFIKSIDNDTNVKDEQIQYNEFDQILNFACSHSTLFLNCLEDYELKISNLENIEILTSDFFIVKDIHFNLAQRRALYKTICIEHHDDILRFMKYGNIQCLKENEEHFGPCAMHLQPIYQTRELNDFISDGIIFDDQDCHAIKKVKNCVLQQCRLHCNYEELINMINTYSAQMKKQLKCNYDLI